MKWNFPWHKKKEEMDFLQQEKVTLNLLRKRGIYLVKIIVLPFPSSTKEREISILRIIYILFSLE
jgi:hypothetical protein